MSEQSSSTHRYTRLPASLTESVDVKPLKYVDSFKATRTTYVAFLDNAYARYFADVDKAPMPKLRKMLGTAASLIDNVYAGRAYCINGGDATIAIGLAKRQKGLVSPYVTPFIAKFDSEELKRRKREFRSKVGQMLKASFGDQIACMLEIRGLATAPDKRKRGYATILMRLAHEMSDAQGRAVFAVTTDAHEFYEKLGYTVVREDSIGGDNPSWHGPPIRIYVVSTVAPFAIPDHNVHMSSDVQVTDGFQGTTIEVQPLRYVDIPKAARTRHKACLNSGFERYFAAADTAPGSTLRQRLALTINYLDNVHCHKAWTIDHGSSIVTLGFPENRDGPFLPMIAPLLRAFDTEELKKRRKEWANATKALLKDTLGDAAKDMIEVQGLVTAPEKQGRGYGTVLMRFVNALADEQNRGVYIFTTGAHGFYQSVGYSILQEAVVGVDNPTWSGDPVHIKLVSRILPFVSASRHTT
ncbi:hypothetical protein C8Q70DRAFT_912741 [Cubamyces menziesii]|nr:hypothetical protein C8Q70DRAFT_912741 [Cubamyces menziesii]